MTAHNTDAKDSNRKPLMRICTDNPVGTYVEYAATDISMRPPTSPDPSPSRGLLNAADNSAGQKKGLEQIVRGYGDLNDRWNTFDDVMAGIEAYARTKVAEALAKVEKAGPTLDHIVSKEYNDGYADACMAWRATLAQVRREEGIQ